MSRFAAFSAALSLLVVGGLVGVLGAHLFHSLHPRAAEPPLLLRGHAVHRLERYLELTPEQSRELEAILHRARDEGEELRADVEPRLRAILVGAMEEIDAMLDPEQHRKFRQVQRRWGRGLGRDDLEPGWYRGPGDPPRERGPGPHPWHRRQHPPPAEPGSPPEASEDAPGGGAPAQ